MMKFFFSVDNRANEAMINTPSTQWSHCEHSIQINVIFDFLRKITFQADLM